MVRDKQKFVQKNAMSQRWWYWKDPDKFLVLKEIPAHRPYALVSIHSLNLRKQIGIMSVMDVATYCLFPGLCGKPLLWRMVAHQHRAGACSEPMVALVPKRTFWFGPRANAYYSRTTNQPLHYPRIISTMPVLNMLTSTSISFIGLSITGQIHCWEQKWKVTFLCITMPNFILLTQPLFIIMVTELLTYLLPFLLLRAYQLRPWLEFTCTKSDISENTGGKMKERPWMRPNCW